MSRGLVSARNLGGVSDSADPLGRIFGNEEDPAVARRVLWILLAGTASDSKVTQKKRVKRRKPDPVPSSVSTLS